MYLTAVRNALFMLVTCTSIACTQSTPSNGSSNAAGELYFIMDYVEILYNFARRRKRSSLEIILFLIFNKSFDICHFNINKLIMKH